MYPTQVHTMEIENVTFSILHQATCKWYN